MQSLSSNASIDADRPLEPGSALANDRLGRRDYAQTAVVALRAVNSSCGFVLSVEGAWGSGKTSALSLIDALLKAEPESRRPQVVHFNPWLIGNRDALLKQFLERLATAAGMTSNSAAALKAAKELRAYSHVFGVLKYVPGAGPWASLVERLLSKVGKLFDSVSRVKAPDLEGKRDQVAAALRKLERPIIVLVDDIDRLFPQEVFEVVRIIKAVGDLPNVGYVVAWDSDYVARALEALDVPFASTYPDKIVQLRLPLPAISQTGREELLNTAVESLGVEVTRHRFPNEEDRLSLLYWSGLRELLRHPRDVLRVFNAFRTFEPVLRGEVVFADLLGLAALKVKAPSVYRLLHDHPEFFTGRNHIPTTTDGENARSPGSEARAKAIQECESPRAVRDLIHHVFPFTAKEDGVFTFGRVINAEGHLAAPERLAVALQVGISPSDVSIVSVQTYLTAPERRAEVLGSVRHDNCIEFLRLIGEVLEVQPSLVTDSMAVCVDLARFADSVVFVERKQRGRDDMLSRSPERIAMQVVGDLANDQGQDATTIADAIVTQPDTLSLSAILLGESYLRTDEDDTPALACGLGDRQRLVEGFAKNVLRAAQAGTLLQVVNPAIVLWRLAQLSPQSCPPVFDAIRTHDPSLDSFVLEVVRHAYHNPGGQSYALDEGSVAPYCDIGDLRAQARLRISENVGLPTLAAWKAVAHGKAYFGKSGGQVSE